MQTERQDLGYIPLIGSVDGVLWDSQAKSNLANSNQRVKSLGTLHGSPTQGVHKRKVLGYGGDQGCWGKLHILVTLWAAL